MSKKDAKTLEPDWLLPPQFDADGVQSTSGIDKQGREHPDPVPTAPPLGYSPPPDLLSMIRNVVQSEQLRQKAEQEGFDTFEEAEDFDLEDDPLDPLTDYEKVFEPPPQPVVSPSTPVAETAGAVPPAPAGPVSTPAASPVQQSDTQAGSGSPSTSNQPQPVQTAGR